jgi:transposase
MVCCKHSRNEKLVRNGFVKNKQRYLCRECGKTTRVGDKREKYGIEQKIKVAKLFTEGVGIRSIERIENIPASLIVYWVRGFAKMLEAKLCATEIPNELKEIEILKIDELFTYYQKKAKRPMSGLLWTETEIKLLISR